MSSGLNHNLIKTVKGNLRNKDKSVSFSQGSSEEVDLSSNVAGRVFMTQAYEVNEWIRAIVDLKAERVSQVDFFPMPLTSRYNKGKLEISDSTKKNMEQIATTIMQPNVDLESFANIVKKISKDIDIYDIATVQISKSLNTVSKGSSVGLYSNVSGEEMYVNAKKNGTIPKNKAYVQLRNAEELASWGKYQMIRFSKSVRAGYANGFSPIATIASSVLGDLGMMNYNLKYFENNARPNIAFIFENLGFGKGQGALQRAKTWYNSEHKGKPHLPLFMGSEKGTISLKEMSVSHKDMEFEKLQLLLLSRIMAVYGMQPMVLGILTDTTGKLNSEVQTEQYKQNAILPAVRLIRDGFNNTLIWNENNFGIKDVFVSATNLDIKDEKNQSEIDSLYLEKGVITINQVRNRLQMPSVDWGDEPFVPLNYAQLSTLKEYQEARIQSLLDKADSTNKADGVSKTSKPDGLHLIEPSKIKEICSDFIKMRESKRSKFYSYPSSINLGNNLTKVISDFGLRL
jgi:hypothetical protein